MTLPQQEQHEYQLTWITPNLAAGYAPMSYSELESIKKQGISAIVNLCGEYCDLHEIEENSGFDVYFLPIPDEHAPDMQEMEKALEWMDEAFYLGKKVLVHCRHGMGRTGTFITAYLLRRGLGMKVASKKLKNTRSNPTNYSQWRLLKKYGKKQGVLKIREPSLENRNVVDLGEFFTEYEGLVHEAEAAWEKVEGGNKKAIRCGRDTDECCRHFFELWLIECVYLMNKINTTVKLRERHEIIDRAVTTTTKLKEGLKAWRGTLIDQARENVYKSENLMCPLNVDGKCLIYDFRPMRCRLAGLPEDAEISRKLIEDILENISKNLFFALSGAFPENINLKFSSLDALSGKFVQAYFHCLAAASKGSMFKSD